MNFKKKKLRKPNRVRIRKQKMGKKVEMKMRREVLWVGWEIRHAGCFLYYQFTGTLCESPHINPIPKRR